MNQEIDISNVVLRTERLLIRPWAQSDLDDLYEYATIPTARREYAQAKKEEL